MFDGLVADEKVPKKSIPSRCIHTIKYQYQCNLLQTIMLYVF